MLHNRDFRRIFIGRSISNAGESVYDIALSWYFVQFSNGAVLLGLVEFITLIPNLFSFLFGKIIDKYPKKQLLIICELTQAIGLLGIALSIIYLPKSPIPIFILVFIASNFGVNAYTIQDALIPYIVPQNQLPQSASYMAFAYNGIDYLFNALAGFLLNAFSVFKLIIFDILTFLGGALIFSRIKHNQSDSPTQEEGDSSQNGGFFLGFKTIINRSSLVVLTLFTAIMNFLFGGLDIYQILLAKQMGGAQYLGLIQSLSAVGILIGSTVVANFLNRFFKTGTLLVVSSIGFGLALAPVILFHNGYLFVTYYGLAFIVLGLEQTVQAPIMQAMLPKNQLGRILSSYYTVTLSALAAGALIFGFIGLNISPRGYILIFSISMIITGLAFFFNRELREYTIKDQ